MFNTSSLLAHEVCLGWVALGTKIETFPHIIKSCFSKLRSRLISLSKRHQCGDKPGQTWPINLAGEKVALVKQPQGEPRVSHSCLKFCPRLRVSPTPWALEAKVQLRPLWADNSQSLGKRPGHEQHLCGAVNSAVINLAPRDGRVVTHSIQLRLKVTCQDLRRWSPHWP